MIDQWAVDNFLGLMGLLLTLGGVNLVLFTVFIIRMEGKIKMQDSRIEKIETDRTVHESNDQLHVPKARIDELDRNIQTLGAQNSTEHANIVSEGKRRATEIKAMIKEHGNEVMALVKKVYAGEKK